MCTDAALRKEIGGFSLLEILIVVAILALIAIIALPGMTGISRVSVRKAATDVGILINEAATSAQATGKTFRIVYDIDDGKYWAESSSSNVLIESDESKKLKEKYRNSNKKEEPDPEGASFAMDKVVSRSKSSLPLGVKFKSITTEQSDTPITEGMAYTHIFPQGQTEKCLVILADGGQNIMSLNIVGLLGKTEIEGRELDHKEVFGVPKK